MRWIRWIFERNAVIAVTINTSPHFTAFHTKIHHKINRISYNPGRGLVVNFRKKRGEMRWKKIIFTAYFLHLFAVNAVNRGELFFFTAFSVFLQKRIVPTRVRSSDLLHAFSCLLHCPNCHLLPWHFSWI